MSESQSYFYLKLKDDFFDRPEIKAIEKTQSGYEYICIIQKMYLKSLCRGGKLMLTDSIPYDLDLLSSVLEHKKEIVAAAIALFQKYGLIDVIDDKTIYMTQIQNFIGQSTTEADRVRSYRKSISTHKKKLLQKSYKSTNKPDNCTPELELKIEPKDISKSLEIESKVDGEPSSHSKVIDNYHCLYFDSYGMNPVTDAMTGKLVKDLLSKQTADEIVSKLKLYFENEYWFNKDCGRDFKQFRAHYNEIVPLITKHVLTNEERARIMLNGGKI